MLPIHVLPFTKTVSHVHKIKMVTSLELLDIFCTRIHMVSVKKYQRQFKQDAIKVYEIVFTATVEVD